MGKFIDSILDRNPAHVSGKLKGSKRLPGESYSKYRQRLKEEARLLKEYLKGDLVWCAKAFRPIRIGSDGSGDPVTLHTYDEQRSKGTYIKSKHGHIESPRRAK